MTPAQNTDTRVNRTKLRARTDEDLLVEGIVLRACLAPLPGGLWGTPWVKRGHTVIYLKYLRAIIRLWTITY